MTASITSRCVSLILAVLISYARSFSSLCSDRIIVKPSLRPLLLNYQFENTSIYLTKKQRLADISVDDLKNNGHTIVAKYPAGSFALLHGGKRGRYSLKQFHFHAPSEHTINGRRFDMEMHLVHKNKFGQLAVIGIMFQVGTKNKFLSTLGWKNLPKRAGKRRALKGIINALKAFPFNHFYTHYKGSLTTPPCTEGVRWYVLTSPVSMSRGQLKKVQGMFGKFGNARPVQALNGRRVVVPELPAEDSLLGF